MILVLDASVVVKWLLQDPTRESETDRATRLVEMVAEGEREVLQPPHWMVEVGAVLARESPATAANDLALLAALQFSVTDDPPVLERGVELAIELKQHLFDTLYHAIALETDDALLVTADDRYWRVARRKGRIMPLRDWMSQKS